MCVIQFSLKKKKKKKKKKKNKGKTRSGDKGGQMSITVINKTRDFPVAQW